MTADFSLGQAEYFVAVANTGSMSAAAVRCHASQAGISTAITDRERRLGVRPLVRRRGESTTIRTEAPRLEAWIARGH